MSYHPDSCPEGCPCGKVTELELQEIDDLLFKFWQAAQGFRSNETKKKSPKLRLIKGGKK